MKKENKVLSFICSGHCTPVEGRQEARLLPPVRLHFNVQVEVHVAVEEPLHFLARQSADILQHRAARADNNALLAVALDIDGGEDANQFWGILPRVH